MNDANVKTLVDETVTVPNTNKDVTVKVTAPVADTDTERNTGAEEAPEVAR